MNSATGTSREHCTQKMIWIVFSTAGRENIDEGTLKVTWRSHHTNQKTNSNKSMFRKPGSISKWSLAGFPPGEWSQTIFWMETHQKHNIALYFRKHTKAGMARLGKYPNAIVRNKNTLGSAERFGRWMKFIRVCFQGVNTRSTCHAFLCHNKKNA